MKTFQFSISIQFAVLVTGVLFSSLSFSQCAPNVAPTSPCNNLIIDANLSTPFAIGSTVLVGGTGNAFRVLETGSFDNLSNSGTIGLVSSSAGLYNNGIVRTVSNSGVVTGVVGIWNNNLGYANYAQIDTLLNTGRIIGVDPFSGVGILNLGYGSIDNIQNSGSISGKRAIENNTSAGNPGYIGTITNSGVGANISGVGSSSNAIANFGIIENINNLNSAVIQAVGSAIQNASQLDRINNSATISSSEGRGISNSGGTIESINNSGSIHGATNAIFNASGSTIKTITNTALVGSAATGLWGGTGVDILNTGTLSTLNNAQSNLAYEGSLPANYNVIINSAAQFGKLSVYSVSGATEFGIYPGTVIPNGATTYASVLNGLTGGNLIATSGTYGGGLVSVNWTLRNSSGTTWDLVTDTTVKTTNPVVPNSAAASSLASQIVVAYNGAVATPSASSNPTLQSGVVFVAAVQSLTAPQLNQLTSVHAEGYSSNMTINLEQMKTVANTVMDRIHNGISDRNGNALSYKLDEGRYIWADVAAFNGTVNSYNGLAGFGYNSYYGVVGVDLFRNQTGGLGIYGGAGNSQMTQSTQVSQSFSNNTGYVGMYGGLYLTRDVKLSGALGYSFGQSKASRNNPNVGDFTGGVASDSYSSNGAFAAVKLSHSMLLGEKFTLTPFVGGSYSQLNTSAVNELGGGDFNYSINAAKSYQTITFIGAEFVQPLKAGDNSLAAIGFYRFSYNWSANTDAAHTVTATNSVFGTFNQTGANMGPISNLFGLGLQGQLSKNTSLRIGAVAAVNSNGYQYGGGGELRVRF